MATPLEPFSEQPKPTRNSFFAKPEEQDPPATKNKTPTESISPETEKSKMTSGEEVDRKKNVIHEKAEHVVSSFKGFVTHSTLHGLPVLVEDEWPFGKNPLWRKVLWGGVSFGVFVYLVLLTSSRLTLFHSHPTTTSFTMQSQDHAIFPAVTFCPLNVISTASATHFTSKDEIVLSDVLRHGHNESDFVVQCTFDKRDCSSSGSPALDRASWWSQMVDRNYGTCFTFDPDNYVNQPNRENGLALRLNLNPKLYQAFSPELGFVFKAHEPGTLPNMNTGVKVASGTAAEITIRKTIVSRPPWPYTTCKHRCEDLASDDPDFKSGDCLPKTYVRLECVSHCVSKRVKSECGCGIGLGPEVTKQCSTQSENNCLDSIFQGLEADDKLLSDDGKNTCADLCRVPCLEEQYEMALSGADYPAKYDNTVLLKAHAKCSREVEQMFVHDDFPACKLNAKSSSIEAERSSTRRLNMKKVSREQGDDVSFKLLKTEQVPFPFDKRWTGDGSIYVHDKKDWDESHQNKDPFEDKAVFSESSKTRELASDPNQRYTLWGCECAKTWNLNGNECDNYCCNPDEDEHDWCMIDQTNPDNLKCNSGTNWHYCLVDGVSPFHEYEYESKRMPFLDREISPSDGLYNHTTLGCKCQEWWAFEDIRCDDHCCNPDNSTSAWCFVEDVECQGGLNWGYCGAEEETCADKCPLSYLGDGFCDPDCQNQACEFDGGDCGLIDARLVGGGLAAAEELNEMAVRFAPSEACRATSLQDIVKEFQNHEKAKVTSSGDLNLLTAAIARAEVLGKAVKKMAEYSSMTVGDFSEKYCGVNPGVENLDVVFHWEKQPAEEFITLAWEEEKAKAALVRIYYSEFNVQESITSPLYDTESLLAELGGFFGLGAGFSVMTVLEWVEFFVFFAFTTLFGVRTSRAVYAA